MITVKLLYNSHLGTEESGRCKEVAVVERFYTRVNVWIFCQLGRKKVAIAERWLL